MSALTVTTEQVRELIEQLAAMTAAASITPQMVANIFENMRQLNDQEREKVIATAEAYITEIQEMGISADNVAYGSESAAEALNRLDMTAEKSASVADSEDGGDLDVSDPNGYVIARMSEGHFQTKKFDSRNVCKNADVMDDDSDAELNFSDARGNVALELKDGHLKTKEFDSREIPKDSTVADINLVMPNLLYKIAAIEREENAQCVIGLLGDSWTQHNEATSPHHSNYVQPFAKYLRDKYGNAGGGFYSFSVSNGSSPMCSVDPNDASDTRSSFASGLITYRDQVSGCRWIDAADAVFNQGATLTLNINTAHTKLVIHYFGEANGGVFSYKLDNNSAVEVDSSTTNGHTTIELSCEDSTHTLVFNQISGSTMIFGVDMQRGNAGVRIHKFGNKGATSGSFVNVDSDCWKAAVASLSLDTMTILLGTNDGVGSTNIKNNLKTIIQRVRSVNEFIDLCLIQPSDNAYNGGSNVMYNQSKLQKAVAEELSVGFINLRPLFGSPQQIIAKQTFYTDGLHPSWNGGRMIADYLLRKLYIN